MKSSLLYVLSKAIFTSSGVPTHSNGLNSLIPNNSLNKDNKALSLKRFLPKISSSSSLETKALSWLKTNRHFAHLPHHFLFFSLSDFILKLVLQEENALKYFLCFEKNLDNLSFGKRSKKGRVIDIRRNKAGNICLKKFFKFFRLTPLMINYLS